MNILWNSYLLIALVAGSAVWFWQYETQKLKKKIKKLTEQKKKTEEENRKLRNLVDEQKKQIRESNEQKKNTEEENRKLRNLVEEQKKEIKKLSEQKQNDEAEIRKLKSQVADEQKQNEEEIQKLQNQVEFFEARFFRVDLILDPRTAHPRLEVAKDGKSVRDTGKVLQVPNSKERFDSHMFVLAKEGFIKGKHYWEVEVGPKKNWDLGVASESISRKGRIILAPQNGYWVIGLDGKKDYWARTEPWTHLVASGKPTKIGMFLNVPERSLTFYDVNRRKKLHTYTLSSFGEKLYPFFSIGSVTVELDSHPLEIPPWFKE